MSSNATQKINNTYSRYSPEMQAILNAVRTIIHKAEPSIEETWKWGPAFEKNGLVLGLWGFRNHVSLVFYRGAELSDKHKLFNAGFENAKNRMIKFTSVKEVNRTKLVSYIREAVKLNASGKADIKKAIATVKRKIVVPADLAKWFSTNKKAKAHFDSLAYTYQKEMVNALRNAKQADTRKRRFEKICKALQKGKKTF